jgi:acetyl-CoA acyltransferase
MAPLVVGVGQVACRRWEGERTAHDLALETIRAALLDAGLRPGDVDGLYTTQVGWSAPQEKFLAQRMAETLGVEARAQMEVECGGASALVAFRVACADVEAGRVACALVWAADVEVPTARFDPSRHLHLVEQARTFYGPYVHPYGVVTAVPLYAMTAQAYLGAHGVPADAPARLAVQLRRHAAANPLAHLRHPIAVEDVLASRVVSPPLRMLECAPWSDGAAAVVVAGPERGGPRAVRVRAVAEAHDPTSFAPLGGDLARLPNVARAAAAAYERSGVGPGDLDVAEVYGPFAPIELLLYEELGLAGPGGAAEAVSRGRTTYGGDCVVNPSGGRLSFGHPPYATPLYELAEVVAQLRGEAGERQVPGARLGLVHAEHGRVDGSVVAILEAPRR